MNKICHLTSVHPPLDIRIFYKECTSLVNADYDVTLIAPIKQKELINGIKIIPINLSNSRVIRILTVTFKMWSLALKTKAELFHFHDPELLICGVLLKLSGKKVIFDIHENIRLSFSSKHWLNTKLAVIVKLIYYLVERLSLLFFDALVLAEESYQSYYPQKKSCVVLNYPLFIDKSINNNEFINNSIKLIYTGGIHINRGIWEMLFLVKNLKDNNINVTLDLVGQMWPNSLITDIEQYIFKNNIGNQINIHGRVNFKEVSNLLENSDIGISILKPIPNYKESLPTKIFEYMQHGLPVISNSFELLKTYVERENVGICIDIDNISDELGKIISMFNDREQMKIMSLNGIELTANKWNWNTQEKKLIDLYNLILK